MVPSEKGTGDQWQEALHPVGRNAAEPHAACGTLQGGGCSGTFPFPQGPKLARSGDTLEAGPGCEKPASTSDGQPSCAVECLATGLIAHEAPQPISESFGGSASAIEPSQAEEKHLIDHLQSSLQTIILINNDVACYVNSAFWTLCWAHLLCTHYTPEKWMQMTVPFAKLLQLGPHQRLDLKNDSMMLRGMQQWNQLRHGGQQDYSDFLAFLLGWMDTKTVFQEFERRYQSDQGFVIAEKGGKHAPITFHSDLWENLDAPTPFGLVIQQWHEQHDMQTDLTIASPLICMQVCRFEHMDRADRRTLDFGTYVFQMMIYTDTTSLKVAKVPCQIVATLTYSGTSWNGHYQSAVLLGNRWLLQNDNVKPQIFASLPTWFANGISYVWLVRCDYQRKIDVDETISSADALAEVQALLRE